MSSSMTAIESTELVFVNQTNHHGTLFGGQVLIAILIANMIVFRFIVLSTKVYLV